jgi:DNA replication protein DnaC
MTKIEETLKKIAGDISKENLPHISNIDPAEYSKASSPLMGDPNCPICGGVGYIRRDLPMDDPDFGKMQVCSCRAAEVSRKKHKQLFEVSNLSALQDMTFDTFNPRGRPGTLSPSQGISLESGYNRARQFASDTNGWLLLIGGFGCGKTHLAAAIANEAVNRGVPTLFLTVPDLLDWMRFAYESQDTTFEDRFDEIRNIPLLVMDDFGTQNATPWAQEKIFQILNYRYVNRLSLVLTSNLDMKNMDERIRSRLQDPALVQRIIFDVPDYRNPMEESNQSELSSLHLHGGQTFESFDLRRDKKLKPEEIHSLDEALRGAKSFAARPEGWMVITGGYGCGKTHLAAAIGNFLAGRGEPPLFVSVPDLLDHLRATFSPNSSVTYDMRFEEIRTVHVLILDDLGMQSASPWAQEKLFQLLNYRYYAKLPTVITTSTRLEEMDTRLITRLLDHNLCTIYGILAPAFYGAEAIRSGKTKEPSTRRKSLN